MPYYAFIVGVNQDWPEQRCSHGDIGLARCLLGQHVQLPREHLVEVYDEMATRSNILRSLDRLLDLRRRNKKRLSRRTIARKKEDLEDTLLFYYGGHGKHREFCTVNQSVKNGELHTEPWLKHSDIIELLERRFKGGTVWCIIDCCHSGGFGQAVVQKYRDATSLNVNYGCIMSVPPADEAGLEWTMTECLIRAFTGDLRCSKGDSNLYYLSTKNGIHPIKNTMAPNFDATKDNIFYTQPSWEQVIEYLSDEMARIKGNRLTTLFLGEGMEDGNLLKRPCIFRENTSDIPCSSIGISRDETWMEPFLRRCHTVSDGVFVKYVGNSVSDRNDDNTSVLRIGWFPGRIISITEPNHSSVNEDNRNVNHVTACIELYDSIFQSQWTITLPLYMNSFPSGSGAIIGGHPFGFGFSPLKCATAITRLAEKLAYYDTTFPSGISVTALWEDGKFYTATTLCYQEVNWEGIDFDISIGPCVPLRWDDDNSVSFVPTVACIIKGSSKDKISSSNTSKFESTPTEVMMASFERAEKTLNGNCPICERAGVEDNATSWEAYDAEDCEWTPVTLMNTVTFSDLPLMVLAYHMCYLESGAFSVIHWESDSSLSVVPNTYLRRRFFNDEDSDDDNSEDSSSCADEVETSDHEDVEKYIAGNCSIPKGQNESHRFIMKCSVAVVIFGLGALVGFKSKR
jgi:hypothetical protein